MQWLLFVFTVIVIVAFFLGVSGGRSDTEERLNEEHSECVQSLRDEYEDGEGELPSNLIAASAVCGMTWEVLASLSCEVHDAETREETALAAGSFLQAVKMVDDLNLIDYDR